MQDIKIAPQSSMDDYWYQQLCNVTEGIGETFIMLMPDKVQLRIERSKFLESGCRNNPNLRPKHLDDVRFVQTIVRLTELQSTIALEEQNEYIRDAYVSHIRDYVINLHMVQAAIAARQDDFIEYNTKLYGKPDDEIFAAVCTWIRQDLLDTPVLGDTHLGDLRARVLPLLPDVAGDSSKLLPDPALFMQVRNLHFKPGGYFDQLFAPSGMPDTPYIEQFTGDKITRQAIANVGSDYSIEPAADGLWAVLSRSRKVVRPEGYRVDRDYFTGVIAHEIGSHLLEESNGSRQSLRLLGLGLNGFEKGNEGRAYLREQIVYGDESVFVRQPSWEYILLLHLSVSLAYGMYRKPYTFAELYELLAAVHGFWRARRYPLDTNNEAQASDEAWLLAVRVMKGTDGTGGCYMKDTVYLQGSIACWEMAAHNPDSILLGDIGKFNINDATHLSILRGLGILPAA